MWQGRRAKRKAANCRNVVSVSITAYICELQKMIICIIDTILNIYIRGVKKERNGLYVI